MTYYFIPFIHDMNPPCDILRCRAPESCRMIFSSRHCDLMEHFFALPDDHREKRKGRGGRRRGKMQQKSKPFFWTPNSASWAPLPLLFPNCLLFPLLHFPPPPSSSSLSLLSSCSFSGSLLTPPALLVMIIITHKTNRRRE